MPDALHTEVLKDFETLRHFAQWCDAPETVLVRNYPFLTTPRILGRLLRPVLDPQGLGVAWIRQVPLTEPRILRLYFLAVGLQLGDHTLDTYGRLYHVHDAGVSYQTQAVPVSQTRDTTGMHTDSSLRLSCPERIGLLCLQPATQGGQSQVVSALRVHEDLRLHAPHSLARLYRPFIRDIVTPQTDRSPQAVAANAFPIFEWHEKAQLRFRYMRYWIERGHERCQQALSADDVAALDALDAALHHADNVYRFRLSCGDMLFIDNTRVAHDRTAFEDHPAYPPRSMVRLWLCGNAPFSDPNT